jgi:hypothetical protein
VVDAISSLLGRFGEPEPQSLDEATKRFDALKRMTGFEGARTDPSIWFAAARAAESVANEKLESPQRESRVLAAREQAYRLYEEAVRIEARCTTTSDKRCTERLTVEQSHLARYRQLYLALELNRVEAARLHARDLRKLELVPELEALVELGDIGAALAQVAHAEQGGRPAPPRSTDEGVVLASRYLALVPSSTEGEAMEAERMAALNQVAARLRVKCASELERAIADSVVKWVSGGSCESRK